MQKKVLHPLFLRVAAILLLLSGLYFFPPLHSRLAWRVDSLHTKIKYYFNPPDEAIFHPSVPTITPASHPTPTSSPLPKQSNTPLPTAIATPIAPTPLPQQVTLKGIIYVDQHNRWNYCGPANLTMALKFWGWKGNRDDVARVIKPGAADEEDFIQAGKTDKNVMPYEMVDFVNEQTEFRALSRQGGELNLLKKFLSAGFPVMVEKGYYEADYTGKISWMGHYQLVSGYNDVEEYFIVQDTYNDGPDFHVDYTRFEEGWRSFNYLFLLVYPSERNEEIYTLLGQWQDEIWARQHALEKAVAEESQLTGNDRFFAVFNQGTSLVSLQRYAEAAAAYDRAFALYAELGQDDTQRPYRIIWYQTGPYFAYFYTGRYQDVINLADTTLNETINKPTLEESLYWRAMAEYALGDYQAAFADMRETVRLNPHFSPGLFRLNDWGIN